MALVFPNMSTSTRKTKMRRGAVLVETAMVFPLVLLLICGIMQYSVFFADKIHLNYAAYQMARGSGFADSGGGGILKNIMPTADSIPVNDPDTFSLAENTGSVQAGVKLVGLECKSPVFFPGMFEEPKSLSDSTEATLHAIGFAPVVSIEYEDTPSWLEIGWDIIKLGNPFLWWL